MKVLVSGAHGMLGTDVMTDLKARGHEAVGAGRTDADITNLQAVMDLVERVQPDAVINCAAFTNVDGAEANPDLAHLVNGAGARNLSVAANKVGAKFLHMSSDYVFDGLKGHPYVESDQATPVSTYGESKYLGEFLVRTTCPRHFIVRTQWLFGHNGPNFVRTILRLSEERSELRVVDDQVGSPTYTKDLAPALVDLIEGETYGTYHVTNSGQCSWYKFACEILDSTGRNHVKVVPIPSQELNRPARRPLHSILTNRLWLAEGRRPLRSYRDALQAYVSTIK